MRSEEAIIVKDEMSVEEREILDGVRAGRAPLRFRS